MAARSQVNFVYRGGAFTAVGNNLSRQGTKVWHSSCQEKKPSRLKVKLLAAAGLLFCSLLLQAGVRVAIINKSYRLENLRQSALARDHQLRTQKLHLAVLTSPENLASMAQSRLGLRRPMPQQFRSF